MKYRVQVQDRTFDVAVHPKGDEDDVAEILVEGARVEWEMEQAAPGVYTLLVDGHPYDVAISRHISGYNVVVRGVPMEVVVEDERQQRLASAAPTRAASDARLSIRAPMPGRVNRVDVDEGDKVEKGARLLVLEAMKMENDILAPRDGRVEKVHVSTGQIADQGQPLVELG